MPFRPKIRGVSARLRQQRAKPHQKTRGVQNMFAIAGATIAKRRQLCCEECLIHLAPLPEGEPFARKAGCLGVARASHWAQSATRPASSPTASKRTQSNPAPDIFKLPLRASLPVAPPRKTRQAPRPSGPTSALPFAHQHSLSPGQGRAKPRQGPPRASALTSLPARSPCCPACRRGSLVARPMPRPSSAPQRTTWTA